MIDHSFPPVAFSPVAPSSANADGLRPEENAGLHSIKLPAAKLPTVYSFDLAAVNGPSLPAGLTQVPHYRISLPTRNISLGLTVIDSHAIQPDRLPTYVAQNFVPPLNRAHGQPVQIDATPLATNNMNHLAIPCLMDGEKALVTEPPPGLISYYIKRGLIAGPEQVVTLPTPPNPFVGYPDHDPLSLAVKSNIKIEPGFFVSAFTSPNVREMSDQIGLLPVQQSDSSLTNNKLHFREAATEFRYSVCPGIEIRTDSDAKEAVRKLRHSFTWIKHTSGFGGDLLHNLRQPLTLESIHKCRDAIREAVLRATAVNQIEKPEELWPAELFGPAYGSLIIEEDVRHQGDLLINGSCLVAVGQHGEGYTATVCAHFKQLVDETGAFLGSMPFSPDADFDEILCQDLENQLQGVARYCHERLNLHGLIGVDYFIIRSRKDGHLSVVLTELNGRPPISACGHIVGTQKLGAKTWISRYMVAPGPIDTMEDFERLVTLDGVDHSCAAVEKGCVVPMHLSSIYATGAHGPELVLSQNWALVLVAGDSTEQCWELCRQLEAQNGVKFKKPDSWDFET